MRAARRRGEPEFARKIREKVEKMGEAKCLAAVKEAKGHELFTAHIEELCKDEDVRELMTSGEYEWGDAKGDFGEDFIHWLIFLEKQRCD